MHLFRDYPINESTLKPLYQGFVDEIFKISSSIDKDALSPITDTTKVNSPNVCTNISPDFTKDLFSPSTLKELYALIKGNQDNINNIYKIPADTIVKQNNYESLLEEKQYLLNQKANHLKGVLQEASKIPLNDTDVDRLLNNINDLEANVNILRAKAEAILSRRLNTLN